MFNKIKTSLKRLIISLLLVLIFSNIILAEENEYDDSRVMVAEAFAGFLMANASPYLNEALCVNTLDGDSREWKSKKLNSIIYRPIYTSLGINLIGNACGRQNNNIFATLGATYATILASELPAIFLADSTNSTNYLKYSKIITPITGTLAYNLMKNTGDKQICSARRGALLAEYTLAMSGMTLGLGFSIGSRIVTFSTKGCSVWECFGTSLLTSSGVALGAKLGGCAPPNHLEAYGAAFLGAVVPYTLGLLLVDFTSKEGCIMALIGLPTVWIATPIISTWAYNYVANYSDYECTSYKTILSFGF